MNEYGERPALAPPPVRATEQFDSEFSSFAGWLVERSLALDTCTFDFSLVINDGR